ncbi:hypothetical protein [Paenibacillus sp. TC-CSREp1]|jgi:hypothetical protein|uniref:hypothetical protein n=1 Tax=Paenibacillus sp. TC-CSREp1 TaxID=3410089 RepID=UPI003CFFBB9F
MQLKQEIKITLEKVHFIDRYINLSKNYAFDFKEKLSEVDNSTVLGIFDELGYKVTFNKKEKFFKLVESVDGYKFQFNISLNHSVLEFIWAVWREEELQLGSPWDVLKELLDGSEESVRSPVFRNYAELKEILSEALHMYEEFKRELILIYNNEINDV